MTTVVDTQSGNDKESVRVRPHVRKQRVFCDEGSVNNRAGSKTNMSVERTGSQERKKERKGRGGGDRQTDSG